MRVYDGVTERWYDLRVERVIAQRFMPPAKKRDAAVELLREHKPGYEAIYSARYVVGDEVIHWAGWQPTRELADRALGQLRPGEQTCHRCDAPYMYHTHDRPAFVCAGCGAVVRAIDMAFDREERGMRKMQESIAPDIVPQIEVVVSRHVQYGTAYMYTRAELAELEAAVGFRVRK